MEELDHMNCSLTPLDYVAKFYQECKKTSFSFKLIFNGSDFV